MNKFVHAKVGGVLGGGRRQCVRIEDINLKSTLQKKSKFFQKS
jgi:hypothetical protein